MAIPISHLIVRNNSERDIEMLRRECYDFKNHYLEAYLKCEVTADGFRAISEECEELRKAWQQQQNLLDAIELEMFSSARKGFKFEPERKIGSQASHTKEIYSLVEKNPQMPASELNKLITHPKGKDLKPENLANIVSRARKKLLIK